jgi:CDP-diacylglycerol--glycerol-3-phosphate 3-phosphatidyltransferase
VSLADALAMLRMFLAIPTVWALLDGLWGLAFIFFALAALSDVIDGWLARRAGPLTPHGAFLDPLADKVLVLATLLAMASIGVVNGILVALIVAREAVVFVLRLRAHRAGRRVPADTVAKLKTACEMGGTLLLTTQGSAFAVLGAPAIVAALLIGLATLPRFLPMSPRRVT